MKLTIPQEERLDASSSQDPISTQSSSDIGLSSSSHLIGASNELEVNHYEPSAAPPTTTTAPPTSTAKLTITITDHSVSDLGQKQIINATYESEISNPLSPMEVDKDDTQPDEAQTQLDEAPPSESLRLRS